MDTELVDVRLVCDACYSSAEVPVDKAAIWTQAHRMPRVFAVTVQVDNGPVSDWRLVESR